MKKNEKKKKKSNTPSLTHYYYQRLDEKKLNKSLKTLENRQIIKKVKTVSATKKNIWMLFEVEPDRDLTGGAWYSDDKEFEEEFINGLSLVCFKYLTLRAENAQAEEDPVQRLRLSYAPVDDVAEYVASTGLSKVALSSEEIASILDTLVFDGKVQQKFDATLNQRAFKVTFPVGPAAAPRPFGKDRVSLDPTAAAIMSVPCGVCPVFDNCHEGGAVSPATCVYLTDWLDVDVEDAAGSAPP